MNPVYIIAIVAALVIGNYVNKHWRKWWYRNDVQFAPAAVPRTDLYWGYYACQDEQVEETKGTVNLLHEAQFDGVQKCIQNVLDAGIDTMLDLLPQVFERVEPGSKFTVRPQAEAHLHELFKAMQDAGALQYVKVLYPLDEPNNLARDTHTLTTGVQIIRRVADCYPELAGYKLAVIYAADKPFICQSLFDWIGFDDYDMKSHVMVSRKYKDLVASLLPSQRIMLIPGAAYGQDPVPFVNYAQAHTEVVAIVAFLWADRPIDVGAMGARSNGMAAEYLAAGRSIIKSSITERVS